MKRFIISTFLIVTSAVGFAQMSSDLRIGGELLTDQRFFLKDGNDWAWNETRLDLRLDKRTDKVKFYGNVWLRNLGGPTTTEISGLFSKDQINPWNLDIREAYAEVFGFLSDNLDLKIGRQRIAWGTGDQFNPTDNLNPYDVEDILDFGRHQGSEAISLTWHFNNNASLQGVYLPIFRPAALPLGRFSDLLYSVPELPGNFNLVGLDDQLIMPRQNLAEGSSAGMRYKGFVANFDFSLSYVYGYDGLPLLSTARVIPQENVPDITVSADLVFPRQHVFGADLAGSIGSVGVWGEAAVFLPEKEIRQITYLGGFNPAIPSPVLQDSLVISKTPYVKFIVGADYTFTGGTYLNVQYLHGFIHERGNGNLNDYLIVSLEKDFFNGQLHIRPLAGGMSVSDWNEPSKNYAIFYTPEIMYRGIDNFEIGLGAYVFGGKGDGIFAGLKEMDMLQVKAKLSF